MAIPVIAGFLGRTAIWSGVTKLGGNLLRLARSKMGRTVINTGVATGTFYGVTAGVGAGINSITTPLGINKGAIADDEVRVNESLTDLFEASENANTEPFNALDDLNIKNDVSLKDIAITGGLLVVAIAGAYFVVNGKK